MDAPQPPSNDLPLWQYVAAIGVPALPFVVVFLRWSNLSPKGEPPSFGDSVNMINAFLASAAFAGVILTLLLQRKDLHQQTRQFNESMQMQAIATYLSIVDSRREMIATKPVLDGTTDIRTLHLALSLFQVGKYLDCIEHALRNSAAVVLDSHHQTFLEHVQRVRRLIARIATLDATRRQLEAEDWNGSSAGRLHEWLAATFQDEAIPQDVKDQIACRVEAAQVRLSEGFVPAGVTCTHRPVSRLCGELDEIRGLLVAEVRKSLIWQVPAAQNA